MKYGDGQCKQLGLRQLVTVPTSMSLATCTIASKLFKSSNMRFLSSEIKLSSTHIVIRAKVVRVAWIMNSCEFYSLLQFNSIQIVGFSPPLLAFESMKTGM